MLRLKGLPIMSNVIMMVVNHDVVIYNFRKELVEALIKQGNQVIILSPEGPRLKKLETLGAKIIHTPMNRHGKNPIMDYFLYRHYLKVMRQEKPNVVLTYTIKPNLYAGLAAKKLTIPYLVNVTGLGNALTKRSVTSSLLRVLMKRSFHYAHTVFAQNKRDESFLIDHQMVKSQISRLPGSGVNLEAFKPLPYPKEGPLKAVFISRIMKEKGIEEYLALATHVKKSYPEAEFHVCGFVDGPYEEIIKAAHDSGLIVYHGLLDNVRTILKDVHLVIHPSYYAEGISNVLLEAAASARPIITTFNPGCEETVIDNESGLLVPINDLQKLVQSYEKFLKLDYKQKIRMGEIGRNYVENHFDRQHVVKAYLHNIKLTLEGNSTYESSD